MSNPLFRRCMRYRPERRYRDAAQRNRVYDEMWTGDWWWDLQKEMPAGATIAPVILASDKTQLTNFSGNRAAWPVYLTIGNIAKSVRRKPSKHATVLIGYLPIPKLAHITTAERRSIEGWRIFHDAMERLLRPLVDAGKDGVDMVCSDRKIRRVHPVVASYVADFPEQCEIANIKNSYCPVCHISPGERGTGETGQTRSTKTALLVLKDWWEHNASSAAELFGYKKLWPFWATLPHQNIFQCFTPDIHHQLHKGNFKDHLVKWCCNWASEKDIDQRFKTMTSFNSLRHFSNGISKVKQWAGVEYKNMEKTFLSVIDGILPPDAIKAAQALLDFIHFARYPIHTDESLKRMAGVLEDFHELKEIFTETGMCDKPGFDIPKIHAMSHYIEMIKLKGTADGYNTESPERLHIEFAKIAYRASNKVNPLKQMTLWLQRQEAINNQRIYVTWLESLYAERRRRRMTVEITEDDEDMEVDALPDLPLTTVHTSGNPRHMLTATPSSKLTIAEASTNHHAPNLLPELSKFILDQVGLQLRAPINASEQINIWYRTRIKVSLPPNILYDDDNDGPDVLSAHPARPKTKWSPGRPEKYDTGLVYRFPQKSGLEICRVRLIFTLPRRFHCIFPPIPLAYVDTYQPFRSQAEVNTGMWVIRPQLHQQKVVSEIIPLGCIHMACHLTPQFGSQTDHSTSRKDSLDRFRSFYF
ncbi:hypothetical protein SISSUDRAFT_963209, partial [Sistotremastrum suecicum HHB10207 ss-3]